MVVVALCSGVATELVKKFLIGIYINIFSFFFFFAGDIYLVGCTNVGKSTLFNSLIHSDLCRIEAEDILQRATISSWPGTTLNLLKVCNFCKFCAFILLKIVFF